MDYEKIGKFIYELRTEKKLTQEQLGEKIGINGKTISKWETGKNMPSQSKFYQLSEIFGVSVYELMSGERFNEETISNINLKGIIKYYNSKYKKQLIAALILVLAVIGSFIISSIYFLNNYNRIKVYSLASDEGEYLVSGYLMTNPDKSIFIINDVFYQGNDAGTSDEPTVHDLQVWVKLGDKGFTYNTFERTNGEKLTDALDKVSFSVMEEDNFITKFFYESDNLNDLEFVISYYNQDDEYKEISVKIDIGEVFSNNKLIY